MSIYFVMLPTTLNSAIVCLAFIASRPSDGFITVSLLLWLPSNSHQWRKLRVNEIENQFYINIIE